MNRHRNRFRNQNNKQRVTSSDTEIDIIREQQQRQHQIAQSNSNQHRKHPPKMQIVVLLENGMSFSGTMVMFNNPDMPKCKLFFHGKNKQELGLEMNVNVMASGIEKIMQSAVNSQLLSLHEDASVEFPAWLEKHSTRANEKNPYFNLDEIREEFNYKKARYGTWRKAAELGFFNDMRPQFAKFNKIMRLEVRDMD